MEMNVRDFTSIVQAAVAAIGLLITIITFVWVRVERISQSTKRELKKCNQERLNDRVLGRERRAVLLAMVDRLLAVIARNDPFSPEISETRALLDDFRQRERIEQSRDEEDD